MQFTKQEVIEKVKNAGIVGAGGAGFPAYVKLNSSVQTLIVNAASCEPLVNADFIEIAEHTDKLLGAISVVLDITGAKEGIIALKSKQKKYISIINKALKTFNDSRIKIFLLEDFYPAGDEFILVFEVTGKVIPERSLPLEVGCLVQNVTTLVQIYDALHDIPVTGRFVTIAGEVNNPVDVYLPLGMSFVEAIKHAGGSVISDFKIIHGGPMMGKLVDNIESETVIKTTSLILVLPEDHILVQRRIQPINTTLKLAKSVCCQCTTCSELCPRGLIGHPLEPHKIMRTIAYNLSDVPENVISANLCSECGLCSMYSCPMGLIPHRVNIDIKQALMANKFQFKRMYDDYEVDIDVREDRKVPTSRLIGRLDLQKYYNIQPEYLKKAILPDTVKISLCQHIGVPSIPAVKVGARIKKGELIADIPENKLGAKIHSSIDGKIVAISDSQIHIKRS
jgi:Na+-translocating ferredoxin:NAD+ oxidoreductase RnfC subunit